MGRGGESGSTPTAASAADLLGGQQFQPFLQPDFDAGEFASQALADAHITAQAQTDQLQVHGLALIGQRLQNMCMSCAMQFFDQIRHFCGIMLESGGEIAAQGALLQKTHALVGVVSAALQRYCPQSVSNIITDPAWLIAVVRATSVLRCVDRLAKRPSSGRAPRRSGRY